MSQGTKQQAVRLPVELHAKIVAAATENNRSGHAEMLHRLEQSFTESSGIVRGDLNALEERLLKRLAPEVFVNTLSIDASGMSKEDIDKMGAGFIAEELKPFYSAASPTGRLSKSQPELQEISGLNTLPQAMRRHGGCAFTGLPTGEEPQLLEKGEQVLTIPGALEWDRPGEETSWRVHDGISPIGRYISANTIVEVERRDGTQLAADRAGDFNWIWDASWLPNKDPAEIYTWRLAPVEPGTSEGWIENTGLRPVEVGPRRRVDVKQRNGALLNAVRVESIDWYNNPSHPAEQDITHWRIAR